MLIDNLNVIISPSGLGNVCWSSMSDNYWFEYSFETYQTTIVWRFINKRYLKQYPLHLCQIPEICIHKKDNNWVSWNDNDLVTIVVSVHWYHLQHTTLSNTTRLTMSLFQSSNNPLPYVQCRECHPRFLDKWKHDFWNQPSYRRPSGKKLFQVFALIPFDI